MADAAEPLDTTPTAATDPVASPSSSSSSDSPAASSPAGDTAAEVWRELQQASESGTPPDAPPDPSSAQAARQPDGTPEAPGSLPTRGPIPYDRHQAVLTTARKKEREEAERELRQKLGWAEQYQPEQVQTGQQLLTWLQRDPRGFTRFIQSQIEGDASPAQPAVQEDPEPPPDIDLADGRAVYSADQLRKWQTWNAKQFRQEIDKTYGPVRDRIRLQELREHKRTEATGIVEKCRKEWPQFAELETDIKAAMVKDAHLSFHDAYIATLRDVGLKRQREQWEAERSGQLQRKAGASSIQPGQPRPSTPRPDSELTTRDIVRQEWSRAAG